jgi:hypothetical protein
MSIYNSQRIKAEYFSASLFFMIGEKIFLVCFIVDEFSYIVTLQSVFIISRVCMN